MKTKDVHKIAQRLTVDLTDAGKIIEGGWAGFRRAVIPNGASEIQVSEMRKAFFAGAAHLFASIMAVLDGGSEPTERDMKRMELIHEELEGFNKQFEQQYPLERGQ